MTVKGRKKTGRLPPISQAHLWKCLSALVLWDTAQSIPERHAPPRLRGGIHSEDINYGKHRVD